MDLGTNRVTSQWLRAPHGLQGGTPTEQSILCRDGSRKPVSEWKNCNLARVPSHVVMTNKNNDRAALWNFLNEAQVRDFQSGYFAPLT